jgi:hypothetical protein
MVKLMGPRSPSNSSPAAPVRVSGATPAKVGNVTPGGSPVASPHDRSAVMAAQHRGEAACKAGVAEVQRRHDAEAPVRDGSWPL